jgi:hypothetical protein
VSNKRASKDRKARLAEIQQQQKARERRVKLVIIGCCVVLLAGIAGVVAFAWNDSRAQQLPNLGVSVAAANCDPVTTDSAEGSGAHIGPGTNEPDKLEATYDTVPPSHGEHYASPDISGRDFYTASDRPVLETLVHNLEHGYTILWYDGTKVKDTTLLKQVADKANKLPEASGKFKVVEWDPSRGEFPKDKPYVLSHWSKDAGHRQQCGDLSGQAVIDFVKKYPKEDTQEPGAA